MSPLLAGIILAAATCNTPESIRQQLADKFDEKPVFEGGAEDGSLMTMFASRNSWSLVKTMPNGPSCLLSAGKGYTLAPGGEQI